MKKIDENVCPQTKCGEEKCKRYIRNLKAVAGTTVAEGIIALRDSCNEAINGDWDKSNEGFEDMITLLEGIMNVLEIPEPEEGEDEYEGE